MGSIIIGGCAMLACVSELPDALELNKSKQRQWLAILVGIPLALELVARARCEGALCMSAR